MRPLLSILVVMTCCVSVSQAESLNLNLTMTECESAPWRSVDTNVKSSFLTTILLAPVLEGIFAGIGDALVSASGKNEVLFSRTAMERIHFYDRGGITANLCMVVTNAADPDGSDFRLKLKAVIAQDHTAIAFDPVELLYKNALGGRRVKSMSAAIELVGADGTIVGSAPIPLNASPSAAMNESLAYARTGWMPVPALSDASRAELNSGAKAEDMPARVNEFSPVTVRVTIAETRDFNHFLAIVGEAISNKKSELAEATADRFRSQSPSPPEQADEIGVLGKYYLARLKWEQALSVFDGDQTAENFLKVEKARWAALEAAARAGIVLLDDDNLRKPTARS